MGLGLGGEVGAGDLFDQLARPGFALGDGLQPRQGGAAEVDDVAAGGDQAQLLQQGAIIQQVFGVIAEPSAHFGPMQAWRRRVGGEVQGSAQADLSSGQKL